MQSVKSKYSIPDSIRLGIDINTRIPATDQKRQRLEVKTILERFRNQPGMFLADEVGMGKTFVALGIAHCVSTKNSGPVVVMAPANLVDKWIQDLKTFCELYVDNHEVVSIDGEARLQKHDESTIRYGVARNSVQFYKLLDDPSRIRANIIFLAQGAMSRKLGDPWVQLAIIGETLSRYAKGKDNRLSKVNKTIHRSLAELLWAKWIERSSTFGSELWNTLLESPPEQWMNIHNSNLKNMNSRLYDDPIPKAVFKALRQYSNLDNLAEQLTIIPLRRRKLDSDRDSDRIKKVRHAINAAEAQIWAHLLATAKWKSPLLIMDEAHHLKNPGSILARQMQSVSDLGTCTVGQGSMYGTFSRMLFLTATPFQLGHHELVNVLHRFGDVRWTPRELGNREDFDHTINSLHKALDDSQRSALQLQSVWEKLPPLEPDENSDDWWVLLMNTEQSTITPTENAVINAFKDAKRKRDAAQKQVRQWIVRHNKGTFWQDTDIERRSRLTGTKILEDIDNGGIAVPPKQLLPFFLAARSAAHPGKDLLGEALSSSYEAFRFTRENNTTQIDEPDEPETASDLTHSKWYLSEFDSALQTYTGAHHPKMDKVVKKTVDLWESGEKVLVFAFYRQTVRALLVYISAEIEHRLEKIGLARLKQAGITHPTKQQLDNQLKSIQNYYFRRTENRAQQAVDNEIRTLLNTFQDLKSKLDKEDILDNLHSTIRAFLRAPTTLIRSFPIGDHKVMEPTEAVRRMLDTQDGSGQTWREKLLAFLQVMASTMAENERINCIESVRAMHRNIYVEVDDVQSESKTKILANVREAKGDTKRSLRTRLMRAFNTPFFPDVLVCSQVMGEGIDLQRCCRHVIHHDLAWNPSTIEQRTGRIDRLGCKAEGKHSIQIFLPYLAGAADERQFRVMSDREQWFNVVMGQDAVAKIITPDKEMVIPLPSQLEEALKYRLDIDVG